MERRGGKLTGTYEKVKIEKAIILFLERIFLVHVTQDLSLLRENV